MRKPAFCICENKDADQLRGTVKLISAFIFATRSLLSKSEISSFWPSSVAVQTGLCWTWSKTPKTGFLTTGLHSSLVLSTQAAADIWLTGCLSRHKRSIDLKEVIFHMHHSVRCFPLHSKQVTASFSLPKHPTTATTTKQTTHTFCLPYN